MVDAALEDPDTAHLPRAEKELLAFVRIVNGRSYELKAEDVERVRAAGWSDEAIYDAVSVCALFNFYNRWCDGAGVNAMPPEGHHASGKRLAEFGYAPPEE
jgi:alkylhydroperoxidase family enzyme